MNAPAQSDAQAAPKKKASSRTVESDDVEIVDPGALQEAVGDMKSDDYQFDSKPGDDAPEDGGSKEGADDGDGSDGAQPKGAAKKDAAGETVTTVGEDFILIDIIKLLSSAYRLKDDERRADMLVSLLRDTPLLNYVIMSGKDKAKPDPSLDTEVLDEVERQISWAHRAKKSVVYNVAVKSFDIKYGKHIIRYELRLTETQKKAITRNFTSPVVRDERDYSKLCLLVYADNLDNLPRSDAIRATRAFIQSPKVISSSALILCDKINTIAISAFIKQGIILDWVPAVAMLTEELGVRSKAREHLPQMSKDEVQEMMLSLLNRHEGLGI